MRGIAEENAIRAVLARHVHEAARMRTLSIFVALALASIVPARASACGGGLVSLDGSVGADAQRVFLSVVEDRTEIVMQVNVPPTGTEWGVLIPLPGEPTIDSNEFSSEEMDQMEASTRPLIVNDEGSGGGGCGSASKGMSGGDDLDVGEEVDIGPVTAVSLQAETGDALATWLSDNGFVVPSDFQAIVDEYSGRGRWFVAMKRSEMAPASVASAVGVHLTLAGDQRAYPLRLARMGAAAEVGITVLLFAPAPAAPSAPFTALDVEDLDRDVIREDGYGAAVKLAVADLDGLAFVVERSVDRDDLDASALPDGLRTLTAPGQWFTRLSTRLAAEDLREDADFHGDGAPGVPTQLDVTEERGGCRIAERRTFSWTGLVAIAFAALFVTRRR